MARLYPRLTITSPHADRLTPLAQQINPAIEIGTGEPTIWVAIGNSATPPSTFTIYASSDSWLAHVAMQPLSMPGDSRIPFGAAAAACIAAANVFRRAFRDFLEVPEPDQQLTLSLFDYRGANPPLPTIDIDEHLIGNGAVGNAFIWTLQHVADARGTLHVIEPERVDGTNPQRYVLTHATSAGTKKTELASRALQETHINVVPHEMTWGAYLRTLDDAAVKNVSVAVDTAEARMAIQAALPARILNAWTQPGDVGVSRHDFRAAACLACLYLPREETPSEDALVAEALNLQPHKELVKTLLYTNAPLDQQNITLIASANHIDPTALSAFFGRPLRTLYREGVCAGLVLGGNLQNVLVPLAFQSAMAGVMLAAETIIDHAGMDRTVANVTSIDLLRPIAAHVSRQVAKHESGYCFCQDQDYVARYDEKFGRETNSRSPASGSHELTAEPVIVSGDRS